MRGWGGRYEVCWMEECVAKEDGSGERREEERRGGCEMRVRMRMREDVRMRVRVREGEV